MGEESGCPREVPRWMKTAGSERRKSARNCAASPVSKRARKWREVPMYENPRNVNERCEKPGKHSIEGKWDKHDNLSVMEMK